MFTEHTIDLSSGPVHYQKGGSGPPLLHLHPAGGPRVSPAIERLAAAPQRLHADRARLQRRRRSMPRSRR